MEEKSSFDEYNGSTCDKRDIDAPGVTKASEQLKKNSEQATAIESQRILMVTRVYSIYTV